MSRGGSQRVLVVAGEASGDMHAAALVRQLRALRPDAAFFGIGGDALAAEGVEILHHASEMTVVGFQEVARRYRFLRSVLTRLVELARSERPTLAILVDYPGFNLRLAVRLRALGVPVVYYIAPQTWAWKEGRAETLRSSVNDLIVAFPFEVEYFAAKGITAHFFGHPLVDRLNAPAERAGTDRRGSPTVAYLPGSRRQEIERHMPVIVEVMRRVGPGVHHVIPRAATIGAGMIERYRDDVEFEIVEGSDAALEHADAALVKAGTSTVEAALHGVPFASFYRTSRLSYEIARRAIRIGSITMVNLLAREPVVQEFIQRDATAEALAAELTRLLHDEPYRGEVIDGLARVRTGLGRPGAAERAARHIAERFLP